jgi:hypothetical protein
LIELYKEREIEHPDDDGMEDEDERKREGEVEALAREDAFPGSGCFSKPSHRHCLPIELSSCDLYDPAAPEVRKNKILPIIRKNLLRRRI